MWALYKLQAKGWVSNFSNKTDLLISFIFLMVLGSTSVFIFWNAGSNFIGDTGLPISYDEQLNLLSDMNVTILSSIMLLMIGVSSLNTFGLSFYSMKDSVLMRRIGSTEITKFEAMVAFIGWGITTMLLNFCLIAGIVGICQLDAVANATDGMLWVDPTVWENANWLQMFLVFVLTTIALYTLTIMFVSISKNATMYQMTAMIYFFIVTFLGGGLTPTANREWMDIVSYLSPIGWGTDLFNYAFQGQDILNWGNGLDFTTKFTTEHISGGMLGVSLIAPLIFTAIGGGVALKYFAWD